MDVAEEVGGEFVVTGSEAAAVLEAAEHALDGVAALVEGLAEAAFPAPVAFGRDVGTIEGECLSTILSRRFQRC